MTFLMTLAHADCRKKSEGSLLNSLKSEGNFQLIRAFSDHLQASWSN